MFSIEFKFQVNYICTRINKNSQRVHIGQLGFVYSNTHLIRWKKKSGLRCRPSTVKYRMIYGKRNSSDRFNSIWTADSGFVQWALIYNLFIFNHMDIVLIMLMECWCWLCKSVFRTYREMRQIYSVICLKNDEIAYFCFLFNLM